MAERFLALLSQLGEHTLTKRSDSILSIDVTKLVRRHIYICSTSLSHTAKLWQKIVYVVIAVLSLKHLHCDKCTKLTCSICGFELVPDVKDANFP